ncbi:hypothetical protein FA13DRAFT_418005 [Coprinellus micaceus]|uniref:Uncharacterized protein n=1 Tax=Coprinellus micaceus TaxID=71717 RepID=A0A4Y7TZB0_COPMI|nr:hypothetical protein FA13DRAFT_418005 [Coprinellus micaceus]
MFAVMCPDRKMQWFKNRPAYDRRTLKYIKDLVIKYFEDKYQTSALPGAPTEEELRSRSQQKKNRFIRRVDEPMATTRNFYPADHIQTYLKEPPVQPSVIAQAGGYLKFWEIATITTPQLAKMGLHFVSTPGKAFACYGVYMDLTNNHI